MKSQLLLILFCDVDFVILCHFKGHTTVVDICNIMYWCDLLWSPYVIGQTIIFLPCSFFLLSFFPRLISAVGDWMSTILLHMAWRYCEFRMQVWNLLHAARCKYSTQKSRQKSPSGHHRTTLSGCIFATKACIDNRKETCWTVISPHMSSQYGELRPTNGWDLLASLGYPC